MKLGREFFVQKRARIMVGFLRLKLRSKNNHRLEVGSCLVRFWLCFGLCSVLFRFFFGSEREVLSGCESDLSSRTGRFQEL